MEPTIISKKNQPQQLVVNCLSVERLVTILAGISLVVYGFTRRSLAGVLLLFSGGYLVLRGISGEGFLCDLQKPSELAYYLEEPEVPEEVPEEVIEGDTVTEASWESFPASDPPAWTSG